MGLHLDLVAGDLVVDLAQVLDGQVLGVVDATVHADVLLFGHLGLDLRRVQVRRQHDDRVGQHVGRLGAGKDPQTATTTRDIRLHPSGLTGTWYLTLHSQ